MKISLSGILEGMITAVLFLSCARGPSPSSASVAVLPVLEIRRENRLYDVTPKIVPANKEAEIVITPLSPEARFDEGDWGQSGI